MNNLIEPMKATLIQTLAVQLSHYGLNPSQWELESNHRASTNVIHFRHKVDIDFRVKARLTRKRDQVSIAQLSVVSL